MFSLFVGALLLAQGVFALSLLLLMVSLALSVWEIQISVGALDVQLQDLEAHGERRRSEQRNKPR